MADDITVKVGFDGTQAENGLGKLRKESDSFASQLTTRLGGAFAAMTLFDKGVAFATKTFEKFADISDKAERAGISAEDFQRIGNAAELSGTSMEAAAKAMREIRNATSDAAAGSKKATDALLALGFTQEEITKGEIKSTDVLLKMAAAYKAAGTDAAKFGVATSILSARSASEMIPLLGTGQQELQSAMGKDVVSSEVADQMKAVADQAKAASQALEMLTISVMGYVARALASLDVIISQYEMGIADQMSVINNKFSSEKEIAAAKKEALKIFEEYSQSFRVATLGRTIDGQLMTSKVVDGILNQKFAEMFPADMQRERWLAQQGANAPANTTTSTASKGSMAVIADSLAQVGGGGGVYAGNMVDLANRTADATERTAAAVEQMAGINSPATSPVSSE